MDDKLFKNLRNLLVFLVSISSFQAASSQNVSSLKFLALGDWGGLPDFPYRTPIELGVASQMGKVAGNLKTQFQVALGDNFYFDGVKDISDKRFQETFENTFTAGSLQNSWYFVAGNHDHNGNVSAQIAYTQHSKRWMFPNLYYSFNYTIPGTKSLVSFIMIDTVTLCGNTDHDFSGEPPKGPEDVAAAEKQWAWIESQLINSYKADYVIVGGHFPVYSVAEHGPTEQLLQRLQPMLHKYKVTAYISGHDHNLQHLQYTSAGSLVEYFVIGSANFVDPSLAHKTAVPENSLKFHWADILSLGGFAYIEATPSNMTLTFIEANAKGLYQHTMLPRKL
ncbi:unnamed protein product [Owenia fusiformis]|uniref:Tartrate-resistant acid phosphatase type 5 n=1 Tax=Owenia fusiformis TaxID=6347 RepID=A0A8J1U712_OWEFU|nr:unnamed protein product [Owenia fusiformis]